jgi:hypothetical protein
MHTRSSRKEERPQTVGPLSQGIQYPNAIDLALGLTRVKIPLGQCRVSAVSSPSAVW